MHPAIIIGTVRSLWTWLWGRFVVFNEFLLIAYLFTDLQRGIRTEKLSRKMAQFCPFHKLGRNCTSLWYRFRGF